MKVPKIVKWIAGAVVVAGVAYAVKEGYAKHVAAAAGKAAEAAGEAADVVVEVVTEAAEA